MFGGPEANKAPGLTWGNPWMRGSPQQASVSGGSLQCLLHKVKSDLEGEQGVVVSKLTE